MPSYEYECENCGEQFTVVVNRDESQPRSEINSSPEFTVVLNEGENKQLKCPICGSLDIKQLLVNSEVMSGQNTKRRRFS